VEVAEPPVLPEIEEPEVAFPQFVATMRKYEESL